ncbi:MAG: hypothetical protein DMF70_13480 [Acidobacteria bacterium]|nr:MAG: hypothetical protein DMF70_13480 [Acidobacteriota bacterium]
MKIVQKIETGGTNSTSTPIFRFLTNAELFVSDARHIAHWAIVDSENSVNASAMAAAIAT